MDSRFAYTLPSVLNKLKFSHPSYINWTWRIPVNRENPEHVVVKHKYRVADGWFPTYSFANYFHKFRLDHKKIMVLDHGSHFYAQLKTLWKNTWTCSLQPRVVKHLFSDLIKNILSLHRNSICWGTLCILQHFCCVNI